MIQIKTNPNFRPEKEFIFDFVFNTKLGVPYEVEYLPDHASYITILPGNNSIVKTADVFFNMDDAHWLNKSSLPGNVPTLEIGGNAFAQNMIEKSIPCIYGTPTLDTGLNKITMGVDIFGSCFFMLSRYEELVSEERDKHNRFSASSSVAYLNGFITRPIVDEYIELLWNIIKSLNSTIIRKSSGYYVDVSCDVDHLQYQPTSGFYNYIKHIGWAIFKKRSLTELYRIINNGFSYLISGFKSDPFDTFSYMLQTTNEKGLKATYYFIPKRTSEIDGSYNFESNSKVDSLINMLINSGNKVGMHGSYETQLNKDLIKEEFEIVSTKIKGDFGNRQHYLRVTVPDTISLLDDCGLGHDASLGYADYPGFRCGTSLPFHFYDLKARKKLNIIIKPLVLMDTTFLYDTYLNMPLQKRIALAKEIKQNCKCMNIPFSILWHNSNLDSRKKRTLFEEFIEP